MNIASKMIALFVDRIVSELFKLDAPMVMKLKSVLVP
jgi:hypothetical protein